MTDESYQKVMSEIESMTAEDIEKLSKKLTEEMKLYTPNLWHTGTPTEEGDYLVQYKNSGSHDVLHFADLRWFAFNRGGVEWQKIPDSSVIAWQKITPYEEKENGHTD